MLTEPRRRNSASERSTLVRPETSPEVRDCTLPAYLSIGIPRAGSGVVPMTTTGGRTTAGGSAGGVSWAAAGHAARSAATSAAIFANRSRVEFATVDWSGDTRSRRQGQGPPGHRGGATWLRIAAAGGSQSTRPWRTASTAARVRSGTSSFSRTRWTYFFTVAWLHRRRSPICRDQGQFSMPSDDPPRAPPHDHARPHSSGFPPRSSARSTVISTANPFLSGSRSFSGCTRRLQISSYTGPDRWIAAVP